MSTLGWIAINVWWGFVLTFCVSGIKDSMEKMSGGDVYVVNNDSDKGTNVYQMRPKLEDDSA